MVNPLSKMLNTPCKICNLGPESKKDRARRSNVFTILRMRSEKKRPALGTPDSFRNVPSLIIAIFFARERLRRGEIYYFIFLKYFFTFIFILGLSQINC